MTTEHQVSTGRYLLNTTAVLGAGRQLQNMLNEDVATLDYAVTQLEEAAKDPEAGTIGYRALMFAELEKTTVTQRQRRERISEDLFATVVTDLQIGNVLIAAGQAVGESDGESQPLLLEEALDNLEQTKLAIAVALSSPLAKEADAGRFKFSEAPPQPKVFRSSDAESAVESFRAVSNDTLDELVSGVHGVALAVLAALRKISPEGILQAIDQLGGPVGAITGIVRRLINQGIEKIKQAVDNLVRLIGIDAVTRVKERVIEIWNNRETGIIDGLVARIIGVDVTRERIKTILSHTGIDKNNADKGSNDLAQLSDPFKSNMEMAKTAVNAIGFASSLLIFTPLAGSKVALFAASSYLIILAAVILISMDYADSGGILQRVRGVGEIANSLRPAEEGGASPLKS